MRIILLAWLFSAGLLIAPTQGSDQNQLSTKAVAHGLSIETWRPGTKVVLNRSNKTVLIDITSPFGIDRGFIRRVGKNWPDQIRIRLHLWGLESFRIGNGMVDLRWSVSNNADRRTRMSLRNGTEGSILSADSPYWTKVKFEDGKEDSKEDSKKNKVRPVFEVLLPAKLFDGNPGGLTIQWIDFFRG